MEGIKENFTRIPNDIIKLENELNTKELLIFTIILINRTSKGISAFSLQSLYDILNISSSNTRTKTEIKNILNLFQCENLLYYYSDIFLTQRIEDINKYDKNKIIYANSITLNYDNFTIIKDTDIKNIIEYSKTNKLDTNILLKICLYILSCINENEMDEDYKLAYPKLITIADMVDVTEKTVLKHINALKELKILNFDYAGYKETREGKIKNGNMFYCRYENEKILLDRLIKERKEKGFIKQNKLQKDKTNLKRKITQEINYITKKIINNIADDIEKENLKLLKEEYNKLGEL